MGYEIAEQLGWRIPAQVVIPMASGSLLTKVDKAWRELAAAGIVEDTPWTVFGAQSAGCDPIATAFDNGWDVIKPVKPTGIAKSLNIGNPADGPYALDAIRRTGGAVGRVGDDEIVQGIRDLARTTGVFAETAGGVTVAVLRQLLADGRLDPTKETVVLNTGEGLKTLDPLEPVVGFTHRVEPSLKSVRAAGLIA
jgi:threonine synthase